MQQNHTSFPFTVALDFPQILQIILQLPEPYKKMVRNVLENPDIQVQTEISKKYVDTNRGTLDIELYQKTASKTQSWDSIKGQWPGNETDEQIIDTLEKLS